MILRFYGQKIIHFNNSIYLQSVEPCGTLRADRVAFLSSGNAE